MNTYSFIVSAGGAPAFSAVEILRLEGLDIQPIFLSDRPCSAIKRCEAEGIAAMIHDKGKPDSFSNFAAQKIGESESRLTFSLFSKYLDPAALHNCINIHPGCLNSRPGLGALRAATDERDPVIIATAHYLAEEFDCGKPVMLTAASATGLDLESVNRMAYAMKTYLILALIYRDAVPRVKADRFVEGATYSIRQIPWFANRFLESTEDYPPGLLDRIF